MKKPTRARAILADETCSWSFDSIDLGVLGLIVVVGALPVFFVSRVGDVIGDTVFYVDAARSMVLHHFYGINGRPETNMPPGLSALIAGMCVSGACGHIAIQRVMAALQTLAFVASYVLLRRIMPRAVAASICLLLASSPIFFANATQSLASYFPYFFATSCALLIAQRLETVVHGVGARVAWGTVLAALCVASVMMASSGIALLGALVVRVVWGKRRLGLTRGKPLLAAALVGTAAQALWMQRQPAPLEWPIPGYPRPYLQQLAVKSGNDPELGMAGPADIIIRVASNAADHATLLSELVTHHWVEKRWVSPAVLAVIVLTLFGWVAHARSTGGDVCDWYFAGYEAIYLLWPWALEDRFFLPIAPLACLYLWHGVLAATAFAKRFPRALPLVWIPVSAALTVAAWDWVRGGSIGGVPAPGTQARLSLLIWALSGMVALVVLWTQRGPSARESSDRFQRWVERWSPSPDATRMIARVAPLAILVAVILIGISGQLELARANVDPRMYSRVSAPDDDAGPWIESHTTPNAVIMARQVPTVYHATGRKIVWFPPSSNVKMLMDGIRRLKVDFVVVVHRHFSYYLPSDDDSFASLDAAYPGAFRLEFENEHVRIFKTVPDSAPVTARTAAR